MFLPQLVLGSGLGASYGFPLSLEGAAPSIFNVNFQGALCNLAQRNYIKAAKSDVAATAAQNADRRNDVIMETAVDYVQLDLLESSLSIQREQEQAAAKFQDIVSQRVQAGLDSQMEDCAGEAGGRKDAAGHRTDTGRSRSVALAALTADRNSGQCDQNFNRNNSGNARGPAGPGPGRGSSEEQSGGKGRGCSGGGQSSSTLRRNANSFIRPLTLWGSTPCWRVSTITTQFFLKFQRNNITAGVAIRFPFFNSMQRAAADAAKAEAFKSRKEAQGVKEQVSTETLKLQRSVQQLAAAREVAQLEHQLAQSDIDSAHAKIESGAASVKEEENARVVEHQRYTAYLNSSFELDRAQIQLMRQIGQLEAWALGPARR